MENNLLNLCWEKAVLGTREVINQLMRDKTVTTTTVDLKYSIPYDIVSRMLKGMIEDEMWPKNVRKIDEPYEAPPIRYIITCAEIAVFLNTDDPKPTCVPSLRSHGYCDEYEVFSETLLPIGTLLVIEDSEDEPKLIRRLQIKFE